MKQYEKCKVKVVVKDSKYVPGIGLGPIKKPTWITVGQLKDLQLLGFNVIPVASIDSSYEDIIKNIDSILRPKNPNEKIVELAEVLLGDYKQSEEVNEETVTANLKVLLEEVNYDELIVTKDYSGINKFKVTVKSGEYQISKIIVVTHVIDATPIEPGDTTEYDEKLIDQEFVKLVSLAVDSEEVTLEEVKSLIEGIVEDVSVDVVVSDKELSIYEVTLTRNKASKSQLVKIKLKEEEGPITPEEPEDTIEEDTKHVEEQLELIQDYTTSGEVTVDKVREYFEGVTEGVGVVVTEENGAVLTGTYFRVQLVRNNVSLNKVIRVIKSIPATPLEPADTTEYDTKMVLDELAKVVDYKTREDVNVENLKAKLDSILDLEVVNYDVEDLGLGMFKVELTRNEVVKFKEIKVTHVIDAIPLEPGDTSVYDAKVVEGELAKVTSYTTKVDPTVETVKEYVSKVVNLELVELLVNQGEGVNVFNITLTRKDAISTKSIVVHHDTSEEDLVIILSELDKVEGFKTEDEITVEMVREYVESQVDPEKVAVYSVEPVEGQLNTFIVTLKRKEVKESKVIKITKIIDMTPIQPGDTSAYDLTKVNEALALIIDVNLGELEEDANIDQLVKLEVERMLEGSEEVDYQLSKIEEGKYNVVITRNEQSGEKNIEATYTFKEVIDYKEEEVQGLVTSIEDALNESDLVTSKELIESLDSLMNEDIEEFHKETLESVKENYSNKVEEVKTSLKEEMETKMEAVVETLPEALIAEGEEEAIVQLKELTEGFEFNLVEVEENVISYSLSLTEELDGIYSVKVESELQMVSFEAKKEEEEETPEEPEVPVDPEPEPEGSETEGEEVVDPEVPEEEEEQKEPGGPETEGEEVVDPEVPEEEEEQKEPEVPVEEPSAKEKAIESLLEDGYILNEDGYYEKEGSPLLEVEEDGSIFEIVLEDEEELE